MKWRTLSAGCSLVAFSIFFYPQISISQTQIGTGINGSAGGDNSGYSVSMPDAATVAVGAPYVSTGHVRVYQLNNGTWEQKGNVINGEVPLDRSGFSVNMPDAATLAIGSPFNSANGTSSGQVRVYIWNGGAWEQKGSSINGEAAGDQSGRSISMPDANTVAIGALFNDGIATDAGHVRIYTWNGAAWIQKGADIDGEAAGDQSGRSVNMPDANTVAIGSPFNGTGGVGSGHVRVYKWNGTAWEQKGASINGEAAGDQAGLSVNMPDLNTLAIGAPNNSGAGTSSGHVRVYAWDGSVWVQKGDNINGEAAGDQAGYSVSMPNVNTLAIGAPNNGGAGNISGSVRIYGWTGSAWVRRGGDIDGEAADDKSGWSVSMPDVNTVAVGAPYNDEGGNNAGKVKCYDLSSLPLPVTFSIISASVRQKMLTVSFTSQAETNNDHFLVEASANGEDFTEIASISSKAPGGNSGTAIEYAINIDLDGGISYLGMIMFSLLGVLSFLAKRNRKWVVVSTLVFTAIFISCQKDKDTATSDSGSDMFIRIAQVDKNGTKSYSETVKAAKN